MEVKGKKLVFMMVITFVIVFLMNYLGSDAPDKLERALLTGLSGAVFLAIGLWLLPKLFGKSHGDQQHFD